MNYRKVLLLLYCSVISLMGSAQKGTFYLETSQKKHWVDSVFNQLSPKERLGQLFVVAAYSNKDQNHVERTLDLVCNYGIGGLCFFQGGPMRQANLANLYQANARVPLMISMDAEFGLAMRIDSTMRFPRQMTLGAIKDEHMIYDMGEEIARQFKRIGMHINLAPVIDVNNNPLNPVISNRSFGEDKIAVARKGIYYMQGMQNHGVMANGKHFPGHGDTDMDSHLSLPVIHKSAAGMDSLELYPFKKLMHEGLQSVMVAHLFIPAYDSTKNMPTTLSPKVVNGLLKKDLNFKGLVFTDALNMKGVSSFYEPGKVDIKALLAGNDVLLYSEDVPRALTEIEKAIQAKEISQEEIDLRVKKILSAKYWCGLNHYQPVNLSHLYQDLNTPQADFLNRRLFEGAITVLKNKNNLIPLRRLDTLRIASVVVGDSANVPFSVMLGNYTAVDAYKMDKNANRQALDSLLNQLKKYNTVILSIHNTTIAAAKNYGITDGMINLIQGLKSTPNLILDVFGNPYTLSKLKGLENISCVILSYEGTGEMMNASAQCIFGGISASGRLPVTINKDFKIGDGLNTAAPFRLKYTLPEETGLSSSWFYRIDSIARDAIEKKATPGCQILVAKQGKVIYYKSFGYHSYVTSPAVKNSDIYDLASITKVASTTMGLMKVYEEGKVSFDKKIIKYLPALKRTNKKDILFRDMVTHQAGLQSWIPFWKSTVVKGEPSPLIYNKQKNSLFSVRVSEELYMKNSYIDTMWEKIYDSPVSKEKKYLYSDLGFILTKEIVEKEAKVPIDSLVKTEFYKPLGLSTMGFYPRNRFPLTRIVPTELDNNFRKQLVHGDVHDPAAAMFGGISGHAGLFSNANDMAILMQMLLNKGQYGGVKYLKPTTIEEFTRQQFPKNRRGIGFDKPEPDKTKSSPTSPLASLKTFGHQGFTGTCFWVDPEHELIYIFLSNRVHPDAENEKLGKLNVRTNIQQLIYEAIKESAE